MIATSVVSSSRGNVLWNIAAAIVTIESSSHYKGYGLWRCDRVTGIFLSFSLLSSGKAEGLEQGASIGKNEGIEILVENPSKLMIELGRYKGVCDFLSSNTSLAPSNIHSKVLECNILLADVIHFENVERDMAMVDKIRGLYKSIMSSLHPESKSIEKMASLSF